MLGRSEFAKIIKIEGKVRGSALKTDAEYVKRNWGADGLKVVETDFKNLGYPIEYRKIKDLDWYPVCVRLLSLLIIKARFNLSDDDIESMGKMTPKFSFIVKFIIKMAPTLEKGIENIPMIWGKHYSIGEFEVVEFDDKDNFLLIRLKDFKVHPILCRYLTGYFFGLLQFLMPNENVKIEELRCMFKGDPYHEYRFTWK